MGMRGGFDPAERVEHMKQELGLNDQQVQQITAIFAAQKTKMEAAMKADSGHRQDWRADHEQVRSIKNDPNARTANQMAANDVGADGGWAVRIRTDKF